MLRTSSKPTILNQYPNHPQPLFESKKRKTRGKTPQTKTTTNVASCSTGGAPPSVSSSTAPRRRPAQRSRQPPSRGVRSVSTRSEVQRGLSTPNLHRTEMNRRPLIFVLGLSALCSPQFAIKSIVFACVRGARERERGIKKEKEGGINSILREYEEYFWKNANHPMPIRDDLHYTPHFVCVCLCANLLSLCMHMGRVYIRSVSLGYKISSYITCTKYWVHT